MKINEVQGFPKELLKHKTVPLYKAFLFTDSEEEMKINTSIDLLAISKEAALEVLVNESPIEDILSNTLTGKVVSFAVIKLDKDDLLTKDLVDAGDVFFENGVLSVTLKDKKFKIDVEDHILKDLVISIDENTHRKICTETELIDA